MAKSCPPEVVTWSSDSPRVASVDARGPRDGDCERNGNGPRLGGPGCLGVRKWRLLK